MEACCLFYGELFKPPCHLVFGEPLLFTTDNVYGDKLLSTAQRKVNACIHDINSLLLTIRMGSKSSSVRHLFRTQNVRSLGTLVQRIVGSPVSPPKPVYCIMYWTHTIIHYPSWEEGSCSERKKGQGRSSSSCFQGSHFPHFLIFLILICLGEDGGIPASQYPTHINNSPSAYPEKLSVQLISEKKDLTY